jgi:hypothetical protein
MMVDLYRVLIQYCQNDYPIDFQERKIKVEVTLRLLTVVRFLHPGVNLIKLFRAVIYECS